MHRLVRNPVLGAALAILALGGGNWINGHVKLAEYEKIVARDTTQPAMESYEGFSHLSARTNANLLRPLLSPLISRSFAEGKLEFYRVVVTGGRLLVLFGLFLLVVALLWDRRQSRGARPHPSPTLGST